MEAVMMLHIQYDLKRLKFRRSTPTKPTAAAAGLQDTPLSFFLTHIMKTEQTDLPGPTSHTLVTTGAQGKKTLA